MVMILSQRASHLLYIQWRIWSRWECAFKERLAVREAEGTRCGVVPTPFCTNLLYCDLPESASSFYAQHQYERVFHALRSERLSYRSLSVVFAQLSC